MLATMGGVKNKTSAQQKLVQRDTSAQETIGESSRNPLPVKEETLTPQHDAKRHTDSEDVDPLDPKHIQQIELRLERIKKRDRILRESAEIL